MPYVLDHDRLHRPAKRRRVIELGNMTRRDTLEALPTQSIGAEGRKPDEPSGQSAPTTSHGIQVSDREELIQCIKRGQNPTWIPKPNLRALQDAEEAQWDVRRARTNEPRLRLDTGNMIEDDSFFGTWTETKNTAANARSAFHRGDFREPDELCPTADLQTPQNRFSESPTSLLATTPPSWLAVDSSSSVGHSLSDPKTIPGQVMGIQSRRRAPSLGSSLSSSFVMRTPTSPLVHAVSNSALDLDAPDHSRLVGGKDEDNKIRRRTLPPSSFQSHRISPVESTPPTSGRPGTGARPPSSALYRGHQPRRSLSSFTYHPASVPQSPLPRERRSSLAFESSPRNRLPMVGSFEESILRGRMSSPASKPFDFIAEVGVMGKGPCSASLKCPAHVSVPFQAVFYQYPTSNNARSIADDAPSPYVGTIDLEHNLKPIFLGSKRRTRNGSDENDVPINRDPRAPENTPIGKALTRDLRRQKRRSLSPRISLGGAYRVPKKGQLQIMIRNQHKSAVKLFLVPYDLEGMNAGTKTFVRQRSFSCGPIMEDAVDSQRQSPKVFDPLKDKHILRYLVHLKFCCPAKGRYYLHESIRIVFANRVPDGKETLQSAIQLPEPRYSAYRPTPQTEGLSRSLSEDTAFIYNRPPLSALLGDRREVTSPLTIPPASHETPFLACASPAIPFHLAQDEAKAGTTLSPQHTPLSETRSLFSHDVTPKTLKPFELQRTMSPVQGFLPSTSARCSPIPWVSTAAAPHRSFSPVPVELGDGLLSRQFKTLNNTNADTLSREDAGMTPQIRDLSISPKHVPEAPAPEVTRTEEQAQDSTAEMDMDKKSPTSTRRDSQQTSTILLPALTPPF